MNPETINAIKEALTPIAEKIGQGAEFGWEVVLRQQIVEAWLGVFAVVLSVVCAIALIKFQLYAERKKEKSGSYGPSDWELLQIITGISGAMIFPIVIIAGGYQAITHFLNPAYYALEFFIQLAK